MRKRHLLSWFSNDLPDYLLIILSVIFLLAGLALFINTFHLYEQAEARHLTIGPSWWFEKIAGTVWLFTLALWSALSCYKDWLRRNLETVTFTYAIQMKKVVNAVWWAMVLALAMSAVRIFTILNRYSDKSVFSLVTALPLSFWLMYELVSLRAERRYYRKQPPCNIVAAGFLKKHDKFLDEQDFDKAYDALIKACETAPEGTYLWCRLAYFCEKFRKNTEETDRYMAKAGELITTKKSKSDTDRACYFEYLGLINCLRKDLQKGLDFLKQANDIEPKPERIKLYEQLLSESRDEQSSTA